MSSHHDKLLEDVIADIGRMKAQTEAQQIALEVLIFTMFSGADLNAAKFLDDLRTACEELEDGLGQGNQVVDAFQRLQSRFRHLLSPASAAETGPHG